MSSATTAAQEAESEEIQAFVTSLTREMQQKFSTVLDNVLGKVDEMTKRIDDLERQVGDLIKDQ